MTTSTRSGHARTAGWAVRPAEPADARRMAEVHTQVWRDTYTGLMRQEVLDGLDVEAGTRRWEAILAQAPSDGARTLVGVDPVGDLVALSSAGPARDADAPVPLELRAINVLARAQGSGLADLLMDALVADSPAYLWVVDGNARAVAFYERHGFVVEGSAPRAEYGVTELMMVRR